MQDTDKLFAVIDTNVIVSSLFSRDGSSHPAQVITAVFNGIITPLYNEEILDEYEEVLSRPKFPFSRVQIETIISAFKDFGRMAHRTKVTDEVFPDPDDIVFYEIKMSVDDALLVTGNTKHFPHNSFVVTPLEMIEILQKKGLLK